MPRNTLNADSTDDSKRHTPPNHMRSNLKTSSL
uniref:Uncharacterized protein n=1 Tax=Anguilla anguilla TaxID=7936 RepID=A0A0E9SZ68_ANGAN